MKKIVLSTFFSLLYYVVYLVSNFGITTILIYSLGDELYSFYPLTNNVSGCLVIVSVAINAMLSRHISISYNKKDYNMTEQYYSTAMVANIICAILLSIPILIIIYKVEFLFSIPPAYVKDVKILFALVLFTIPVIMVNTVFSIASSATDKLYLEYLTKLIQIIIKVAIVLWCYYNKKVGLINIGIAVFVSDFLLLITSIVIKKVIFYQIKFRIFQFNKKLLYTILGSGIWNSLIQLGNSLLYQCDLVISNIFLGTWAAGAISITLTIPNAITMLVTTLSAVFMPSLFNVYANSGFDETFFKKIEYAQWIVGGIVGVLVVLVIQFDYEFFDIWIPGNDSKLLEQLSIYYLLPLIYSAMFRCVGNILIVANKMKMQAILTFLNGITNVISMYLLIKYSNLGIFSVVITTALISSVWYILFIPFYVSNVVHCSVMAFYKVPLKIFSFLGMLYVIVSFIKEYLGKLDSFPIFIVKVGFLGCCCYMLFFSVFWYLMKQHKV